MDIEELALVNVRCTCLLTRAYTGWCLSCCNENLERNHVLVVLRTVVWIVDRFDAIELRCLIFLPLELEPTFKSVLRY